uniref:DDE-1 domain-containing protein n=1 Tax=Dendroctonus ponderosae TaxID=77166 RepID=A0AAR5PX74_DENPD
MIQAKNILVTWLKTHYGHKSELQHLRLPQQDKAMVASKLILGVPASRILDSYREKINEKDLNREDLITRKDIQNIKEAYHINISEGVKHDNDAISVDLWVKQCNQEECSCILFYKQQGVEEHDYQLSIVDFCLVIMTDFQKNIMNFGNNIVAIDGTHGLNNYDF